MSYQPTEEQAQTSSPNSILDSLDAPLSAEARKMLKATEMVSYFDDAREAGLEINQITLLPGSHDRGLYLNVYVPSNVDTEILGIDPNITIPEEGAVFHGYVLVPISDQQGKIKTFPDYLTTAWLEHSVPLTINNEAPSIKFAYDSGGLMPLGVVSAIKNSRTLRALVFHPGQATKSTSAYLKTQDVGTQVAGVRWIKSQLGDVSMIAVPNMPSMMSVMIKGTANNG